jgi:hypothetical protein
MKAQMIDSLSALKIFIDSLPDFKGLLLSLYIDLEGNNLLRKGTLSLVMSDKQPNFAIQPQSTSIYNR